MKEYRYTFTLPAWSYWRRAFYLLGVYLKSYRKPWTATRFMTEIMNVHLDAK